MVELKKKEKKMMNKVNVYVTIVTMTTKVKKSVLKVIIHV